MFVFSLLLTLVRVATAQNAGCTQNFVLTSADASKFLTNAWQWTTSYGNDCTLQPGETYTFTVDLSNLEGQSLTGESVTIQGDEGVDLDLDPSGSTTNLDNIDVGGYFDVDEEDDYTWRRYTKCDFGRSVHTFTLRNKASYVEYTQVQIIVRNEHYTCELAAAVRAWLIAILVILGICCGCGILIAILIACGCIACCNQNKTTHVHHTTVQTTSVPQQGGGEFQPAQPNYSGAPGSGTPDMTQYSTGLQPGWEAKWDIATQRPYWVNHNAQQSVWEDPRTNMGSA